MMLPEGKSHQPAFLTTVKKELKIMQHRSKLSLLTAFLIQVILTCVMY